MTEDEARKLAEIEKLCEAATPGPWRCKPHTRIDLVQMYWINDYTSLGTAIPADAKFAAAAREAVPMLLAALRASEARGARTFAKLCRARSALSHCRQACEGDDNDLTRVIIKTVDKAHEDTEDTQP